MILQKTGYSYNDLTLVPANISDISSRSECNPFVEGNTLPIFTAPMASVVDCNNFKTFEKNGIIPILPRNISIEERIENMNNNFWTAFSLKEFKELFIEKTSERTSNHTYNIVVDIANGHMRLLYDLCMKAKSLSYENKYELIIMTGNIANPKTYEWICKNCYVVSKTSGEIKPFIDYIRIGIGSGAGCITSSNCSIHYPQATLIEECRQIKRLYPRIAPKIIADGGIRNYDHVIKALALGADYVMIGSLFAQCIESCGFKTSKTDMQKCPLRLPIERYKDFRCENGYWKGYYTDEYIEEASKLWKEIVDKNKGYVDKGELDKCSLSEYAKSLENYYNRVASLHEEKIIGQINVKFFGMASADGQKSISGAKTKTSEGITKMLPVKYTLAGWIDNMISYLRSAMSYTNCGSLKKFIGTPNLIVNSLSEINAVNK